MSIFVVELPASYTDRYLIELNEYFGNLEHCFFREILYLRFSQSICDIIDDVIQI